MSRQQLLRAGVTAKLIDQWVAEGQLICVHRGVYLLAGVPERTPTVIAAAVLAAPPDAVLSHITAAGLRKLRGVYLGEIHLSCAAKRRNRGPLRFHRASYDPDEVRLHDGQRVATVPRLLIECAELVPAETRKLVHNAIKRGTLTHAQIPAMLERYAGRPGIERLRAATGGYLPRANRASDFEDEFDADWWAHPELRDIPYETNVYLHGFEVDVWIPSLRIAIECDGRNYHRALDAMNNDRLKSSTWASHGILGLRFSDDQWKLDRSGCWVTIKRTVAHQQRALGLLSPAF